MSDTHTKIACKKDIYKVIIIMDGMGQCAMHNSYTNIRKLSDLQWGVL